MKSQILEVGKNRNVLLLENVKLMDENELRESFIQHEVPEDKRFNFNEIYYDRKNKYHIMSNKHVVGGKAILGIDPNNDLDNVVADLMISDPVLIKKYKQDEIQEFTCTIDVDSDFGNTRIRNIKAVYK